AEMAEDRRLVAVFLVEPGEVAEIVAQALGRHRGILPGGPRLFLSRHAARADAVLADVPDLVLILGFLDEAHALGVAPHPLQPRVGLLRLGIRLALLLGAELDEEPGAALRQQLLAGRR